MMRFLSFALLVAAQGAAVNSGDLRGSLRQDPVGGAAEGATGAVADVGGKATGELTSAGTGVVEGKMPNAGEAVGKQVGVNVPNPHAYVGALVGGGIVGSLIPLATFLIATYMVYSWNAK